MPTTGRHGRLALSDENRIGAPWLVRPWVFAVGYAALAQVAFWLDNAGVPAFYPAVGYATAVLALSPRRRWPLLLLLLAAVEVASDRAHGLSWSLGAGIAVANASEAVVAAVLMRRLGARLVAPGQVRNVAMGVVVTGGVVVGAALGSLALDLGGLGTFGESFGPWFVADALGQAVMLPLVLGMVAGKVHPTRWNVRDDSAALLLFASASGLPLLTGRSDLLVAGLLLPIWCAMRFGDRRVPIGAALYVALVLGLTAAGFGPFAVAGGIALVELQEYLLMAVMIAHVVGAESDARKTVEAAARDREESLRAVVDGSPVAITEIDPQSGVVLRWNPAATRIFGWVEGEVLGRPLPFIAPEDREDHIARRAEALERMLTFEAQRTRKDGSRVDVLVTTTALFDDDGRPRSILAIHQDVTERRVLERQLAHQAGHDIVTGLLNRASLTERIEALLRDRRREAEAGFAVLFCDLDRFKYVNDTFGHRYGDQLLIEVGCRLVTEVRETDSVARLGGDEFAVILTGYDAPHRAAAVAARLVERIAMPFDIFGAEVRIGMSVGVAFSGPGLEADALMRDADAAMYRAKRAGRNQYAVYDEQLRLEIEERLASETALRDAVAERELRIVFQPKVHIESAELHGVEALLRWERGGRLVGPDEFIGIAEEIGVIGELGRWVLEEACERIVAWRSIPSAPRRCAVNVSGRQLADPTFAEDVEEILTRYGIRPGELELEITESVMLDTSGDILAVLDLLSARGVRLAIDDFGTGYSSLTYLRRLPVHVVKVDKSFVRQLGSDRDDSTIVAAVIGLAHALGLEVVAEGVETAEHISALHNLGCDVAQGYFFARPLAEPELLAFCDERWATGFDDAAVA